MSPYDDDSRFLDRHVVAIVIALFTLAAAIAIGYAQCQVFAPIVAALK